VLNTGPPWEIPYPEDDDSADVARDLGALAKAMDRIAVPMYREGERPTSPTVGQMAGSVHGPLIWTGTSWEPALDAELYGYGPDPVPGAGNLDTERASLRKDGLDKPFYFQADNVVVETGTGTYPGPGRNWVAYVPFVSPFPNGLLSVVAAQGDWTIVGPLSVLDRNNTRAGFYASFWSTYWDSRMPPAMGTKVRVCYFAVGW
jgi:hypothetical protein